MQAMRELILKASLLVLLTTLLLGCAAHYKQGTAAYQQRDWEKTVKCLERYAANNPEDAPANYMVGTAYLEMNNTTQALKYLQQAVYHDPENNDYRKKLAEAFIRRGLYQNAQRQLEDVLMRSPDDLPCRNNLAYCYMKRGDYEKALAQYRAVLIADPNNKVAHYNAGEIYEKYRRDRDNAVFHYKRFIELAPDSPLAKPLRAYIEQGIGTDEARELIEKDKLVLEEIPTPQPGESESATKKPNQELPRVIVLDLSSSALNLMEVLDLSKYLRTSIFKAGNLQVVVQGDYIKALEELQESYQSSCTSSDCLTELGRRLNVDYIITGNIGSIGDMYIVTIYLFDVAAKAQTKVFTRKIKQYPELLLNALDSISRELP